MKLIRNLVLTITASFSVLTLPAVTLALWDIEGANNAAASLPNAGSIASGVTAEAISSSNVTFTRFNYATQTFAVKPNTAISNTVGYSITQTLTNETYLSLKIKVEAGYTLSLDSFALEAVGGGSASTRAFYVFSNLSGFTADDVLFSDRMDYNGSGGTLPARDDGLKNYSVTLSTPAFQNIAGGTEIEFRVYIQTDGTGKSIDFDNFTLTGSLAAIPEPASVTLLLGLAACAGFLFIRRH